MKQLGITLLKFLSFGFLVYAALIVWMGFKAPKDFKKNLKVNVGSYGYGHLYSRTMEADTTRNIDVLVLGSSHAYRGYDPRIFKRYGLNLFNMGSTAQTPTQSKLLVHKYIDQLSPKLVILDIFPAVFEVDGIESTLDFISNTNFGICDLLPEALKSNNILVYNSLLFSAFYKGFGLGKGRKEPLTMHEDTYITGGYVQRTRTDEARLKAKTTISNKMLPDQIENFGLIIKELKKRNIPYCLIQSPVTKDYYMLSADKKNADSIFSKFGLYFNFNKMLNLNDNFFFDYDHLNQTGVNIFNKEVLKLLSFNKLIRSHDIKRGEM